MVLSLLHLWLCHHGALRQSVVGFMLARDYLELTLFISYKALSKVENILEKKGFYIVFIWQD